MKKVSQVLILLFIFFLAILKVAAAGLSVKPDHLNFVMNATQEETKSIVVENISDRPVIYNLYVDEMEDQIFLAPANFRLEVNEKRQVKVKASPRTPGLFATNLSIVTQDLDRRAFNVATGVKVPVTLQVASAPPFVWPVWLTQAAVFLIPVLAAVIVILAILLFRKKKHWWEKLINIFKKP